MTLTDLLALMRDMHGALPPGDWRLCSSHNGPHLTCHATENYCTGVDLNNDDFGTGTDQARSNMTNIAAVRNALPDLIAALERAERIEKAADEVHMRWTLSDDYEEMVEAQAALRAALAQKEAERA